METLLRVCGVGKRLGMNRRVPALRSIAGCTLDRARELGHASVPGG